MNSRCVTVVGLCLAGLLLGVAFNSTLIALLLSILLMFLMQQLQQAQERRVLDTETWLDQRVIRNLQVVE